MNNKQLCIILISLILIVSIVLMAIYIPQSNDKDVFTNPDNNINNTYSSNNTYINNNYTFNDTFNKVKISKISVNNVEFNNDNYGFNQSNKFVNHNYVNGTSSQFSSYTKLHDTYITLWLHQVHQWFYGNTSNRVHAFLQSAKRNGFTSIMVNVPWSWTEREAEGDIRFDTFEKDWIKLVCTYNFKLYINLQLHEFPPWISDTNLLQKPSPSCSSQDSQGIPTFFDGQVRYYTSNFFRKSVEYYSKPPFDSCIAGFSPAFIYELETRFHPSSNCLRDYSTSAYNAYNQWHILKYNEPSVIPDVSTQQFMCDHTLYSSKTVQRFTEFREEFISELHESFCRLVHEHDDRLKCFLHFGESFSSLDLLMTNPLYRLAKSPYVDDLIIDSNMALFGAPSTPSIVGILVAAARLYGKTIHFEAATERIYPCNSDGNVYNINYQSINAVKLLYAQGISRAIENGVHSIGVTNLCEPDRVHDLLPDYMYGNLDAPVVPSSIVYTGILYVPYTVFYSWNLCLHGLYSTSSNKPKCWSSLFSVLPRFGLGESLFPKSSLDLCAPQDAGQRALTIIWDDMRTRHQNVAVVPESYLLTNDLLENSTERVLLRFENVMNIDKWDIINGYIEIKQFKKVNVTYPFREVVVEQNWMHL